MTLGSPRIIAVGSFEILKELTKQNMLVGKEAEGVDGWLHWLYG